MTQRIETSNPAGAGDAMSLRPIAKMLEAVEIARSDSDVFLFFELMYLGELLTKTIAAGLVAGVLPISRYAYGAREATSCWFWRQTGRLPHATTPGR